MSWILLLLALGLGLGMGWCFRTRLHWIQANRHLCRVAIWALLFFMGSKMALNRHLFLQDRSLLFAAVGSALLLLGVYVLLFAAAAVIRRKKNVSHAPIPEKTDDAPTIHELGALGINSGCILAGWGLFLFLKPELAGSIPVDGAVDWLLRILLISIGFDLGAELNQLDLRKLSPMMLGLPILNILMTLGSGWLYALISGRPIQDCLLMVSGMGWYSLSSVLLAEQGLALLSLLSFIHNVLRELLAILTAPLAARLSPLLTIHLGGATSMDVMLPFVQRYSGREYTLASFYSGVVCSLAVLPLVRLLLAYR